MLLRERERERERERDARCEISDDFDTEFLCVREVWMIAGNENILEL